MVKSTLKLYNLILLNEHPDMLKTEATYFEIFLVVHLWQGSYAGRRLQLRSTEKCCVSSKIMRKVKTDAGSNAKNAHPAETNLIKHPRKPANRLKCFN